MKRNKQGVFAAVRMAAGTHRLLTAGTLLCAAAVTEGSVLVRGACAEHLRSLLFKLAETGVGIRETHAASGSAVRQSRPSRCVR